MLLSAGALRWPGSLTHNRGPFGSERGARQASLAFKPLSAVNPGASTPRGHAQESTIDAHRGKLRIRPHVFP
jgi:hypothetical protein